MRILTALIASLYLASCGRWDLGVEIPFVATWEGRPIACSGDGPLLTDFRLYLSNPQLADADGEYHDVRFATEFEWQNDAVALIDLETGDGACRGGTEAVFDRVIGVARARDYRGLRFTVGVPFRLNHQDPGRATPPLGDPAMQWHSMSGYTFLRAGVKRAPDAFRLDVASAGCEGSASHVTGCRFPNRIEVLLPDFVPGHSVVEVDLAALEAGIDMVDGDPNGAQGVFSAR